MKSFGVLALSVLLAAVSAMPRDEIKAVCESLGLSRRECFSRARTCGSALRDGIAHDQSTDSTAFDTCKAELGIEGSVRDAIRQGAGREAIRETKDAMKECVLREKGLLNEDGSVDGTALREDVVATFNNIVTDPDLLTILVDAANACEVPTTVDAVETFKKCIGETCITNQ